MKFNCVDSEIRFVLNAYGTQIGLKAMARKTLSILRGIFLCLAIVFGCSRAHAAVEFVDDANHIVANFADNGEIFLSGKLMPNISINQLPSGKKWYVKDNSGNVLMLLALQNGITLSDTVGTVLNAGDLMIRGSVQLTTFDIPSGSNRWYFTGNGSAIVNAITNSSDNLYVKVTSGQTQANVIHENNGIFSATVVSNPFIYHPADLSMVTNRQGKIYDVGSQSMTNPTPWPTTDPNYRYVYSMAGIGDMVQATWARDDNGKPVIYFVGTDGYGLSYVPGEGHETFDFPNPHKQKDLGYSLPVQVGIAVSKFTGKPGNINDLALKYSGHVMAPDSCGKTLSRFLWRAQVQESSNMQWSELDNHFRQFTESDFLNCNTHMMDGEMNVSGILYLDNALYMTISAYSGLNNRNDITDCVEKDVWGVYMFKSVDETINGRHHEVGEIWHPLIHRENASELWHLNMYDRYEDGSSLPTSKPAGYEPPCKIFDHNKLAMPFFIQFGRGYEDYRHAFPSGPRYVYLMSSPKRDYHPQSEMYLARADATSADNMRNASSWQFYSGISSDGSPLWTSDKDKATSILYSPGELGPASAIYHKPSGRFLMSTWSNSDKETWDGRKHEWTIPVGSDKEPYGSRHENRWFLWEAPNPWGPWRKILSNDFNGRQNDISGLNPTIGGGTGEVYGYCGYNVALIPAWMENNTASGGWNIWAMQAGFSKLVSEPDSRAYSNKLPWLEETTYTNEFMKISLNPVRRALDTQNSALCEVQQNTWKSQIPTGGGNKTLGYFFTLSRDLNITHLGRYYDTGAKETHNLSIYQVTLDNNGNPMLATAVSSLATVPVTMAHHSSQMDRHGFIYGKLSTPLLLKARDTTPQQNIINYLLVSEEHADGDKFFGEHTFDSKMAEQMDLADVRTGNSVTVRKAAQYRGRDANNRDQWDLCLYNDGRPYPGNSFGPLNFLFDTAPEQMASGQTSLASLIEQDCLAGCQFTVAAGNSMTVTDLGRYRVPGNTRKHEVRLMRAADPLASNFTNLSSPINQAWYAGCMFTVPPGRQIGVSQLGRYKMSGNSGVHRLMLVRLYDDGTTGLIAQADINLNGLPDSQMCYQSLPSMAPLVAGNYCLVSQEKNGASDDSFFGHASTSTSTPQIAITAPYEESITNLKAGYFLSDSQGQMVTPWKDQGWTNRCYGPVGMVFQQVTLASVVIDTNVVGNRMIYQPLSTPVRLTPGNYHLVSREFSLNNPDETFYGHLSIDTSTPKLIGRHSVVSNLKAGYFPCNNTTGEIINSWTDKGGTDRCYGPVGLQFE